MDRDTKIIIKRCDLCNNPIPCHMPRKGSVLTNVVSTKLSEDDFDFVKKVAKQYYNRGYIEQPTLSHALRKIVQTFRRIGGEKHLLAHSK